MVGLLTRIAAFGNRHKHDSCDCDGAWRLRTLHELDRRSEGEGFEYHLLVLAMVVFLMIRGHRGAGTLSVDRALTIAATFPAPPPVLAHS